MIEPAYEVGGDCFDYALNGPNFDFAIMEDVGALKACAATSGCDVTGRMIQDLVYAYNTFEQSPAYMRVGTRPVVFFFGVDVYTLDWTRVRNGVPGNPIFVFRNNSGFTHSQTGGSFSWRRLPSGRAGFDKAENVVLGDPAAHARTFELFDIDAVLVSDPAHERTGFGAPQVFRSRAFIAALS
jgi:hypothetical protein